MSFVESLKQAIESLKSNKLRSFLTMLGIIMGVFSVITILAIGNAAQSYMNAEFDKVGAGFITISDKSKTGEEKDYLSTKDFDIIMKSAPEIENIYAQMTGTGEVRANDKTRDAMCIGYSSQYVSFNTFETIAGRQLSDVDITANAKVVVVDDLFAKRYFKKEDATGQVIQIKNSNGNIMKLKIVGVYKVEGMYASFLDNEEFPAQLLMPITTVSEFFGIKKVDNIVASVKDKDNMSQIGEKIVKALSFVHKNQNKYTASNSVDLQKSFSNVLNVISLVLLIIAIITLVVGGIGIINILLVSVTERIREIGVRKALGAQKSDIVMQFITESIIMTGISGLIGILIGVGLGAIISSYLKLPPVVDIKVIALSFFGSILLGLIFGVYPAKRAADLDPIESLRYE